MWMYFLSCILVNSLLTASENTTTNPLLALAKASNVSTTKSLEGSDPLSSNRQGYERDVLVVLPVMQGNSELTNSNLQMLYTKTPFTTIINEKSASQASDINERSITDNKITKTYITSSATPITLPTTSALSPTKVLLEQSTISAPILIKRDDNHHHPHIEFLSTQTALKTQNSPLDYGYPESFKFVQELNDLPKNHKPEWAQSDIAEAESKKSTATESFPKKDPFLMFESVKPLEINKLLSLKPIIVSATESVEEIIVKRKQETTETTYPAIKQLANKRPIKKPQKVKVNPQKFNNADFTPFVPSIISTDKMMTELDFKSKAKDTETSTIRNVPMPTAVTYSSTHMSFLQPPTIKSDNEIYGTSIYSTHFAESSNVFLPTPYSPPSDQAAVHSIQSQSKFVEPSSENWLSIDNPLTITSAKITKPTTEMTTSSSTTTSTAFTPNVNRVNINMPVSPVIEFSTPPKVIPKVEPIDLISLTKILNEHFEKKHTSHTLANSIPQTTTTKPYFPADMLTYDMKNMLIALGLLKPETDSLSPLSLITSTAAPSSTELQHHENQYVQQEHLTPTIDPNSYAIFKKLPISYETLPLNNDMQHLLSSFGLLPSVKSTHLGGSSVSTRISRQQKPGNSNTLMNSLGDKMQQTLKNLGLMKPMVYQMNQNRHIFKPSIHLEKLAASPQIEKISNALEIIRVLSTSNDVHNFSIEELEQKLRNVTALLHEENFLDNISTDIPQLTTELFSTVKNFIFYNESTTVAKVENSSSSKNNASSAITAKPLQIDHSIDISPTTFNSTGKMKTYGSTRTICSQSRRLGSDQMTVTPSTLTIAPTISLITTSTPHSTVDFPAIATAVSAKTSTTSFTTTSTKSKPAMSTSTKQTTISTKIELPMENLNSSDSTSTITPATLNVFVEGYNEVNYTPDASFISSVELPHSKSNTKLVMSPLPKTLSVEELQNLLKTNPNNIKYQQPQDVTSSTTLNIIAEVILNNISSTIDISTMSETIKNNSSTSKNSNDINSASSESSINDSTTSSSNSSDNSNINSSTEESLIKVDDLSNNNAPLEALADSFGGENEEQVDNWQATAKPNGLYFLLDWNTFLSVAEEDKHSIRIQFSPQAGNPRNFMPITVP